MRDNTFREQAKPRGATKDETTVPREQLRDTQRTAINTASPATLSAKKTGVIRRPLPKWAWPIAAAVGAILLFLLPLLFYHQPGFTIVVRGAPPHSRVFVDDLQRGIPGIEKTGENFTGLIRVAGLKSGLTHTLRVNCGGRSALLYLDNGSSVNDLSAPDGEVVNLKANCEGSSEEIEYAGQMRLIRNSGAFWMGDNSGEANERPAHLVTTLDYDYYIDKFEVSNQQYKEFSQASGVRPPSEPYWDNSYSVNNPDSPVVGVSWYDAKKYCEKVGKRLPTEAEWEKAASWDPNAADDSPKWKRRWPWGNSFDPALVNFSSQHPVPVTQFAAGASAYGVQNLAGNAGEWVEDVYQPYPGSSEPDLDGQRRVVRGGTFNSASGQYLRTTMRFGENPGINQQQLIKKSWLIGFRCAVRSDAPELQKYVKNSRR